MQRNNISWSWPLLQSFSFPGNDRSLRAVYTDLFAFCFQPIRRSVLIRHLKCMYLHADLIYYICWAVSAKGVVINWPPRSIESTTRFFIVSVRIFWPTFLPPALRRVLRSQLRLKLNGVRFPEKTPFDVSFFTTSKLSTYWKSLALFTCSLIRRKL